MQAKIHFVGHTARAPYFFPNGDKDTRCAKFTVITNDGKNAKGEDRSSAHNCTAFGKTADLACWYLHTGKQISINGRLTTMRKETGKIRPDGSAEVYYESTTLVDSIELLADSQKWIADSKAKGLLPQDYGMPGVVTERGKIQDYISGPSYGFATVWEKGDAQPSATTGHNPSGVTDSLDANALVAALLAKKQEAVVPPAQNPAALALLQTLLEQKTSPVTAVESATAPINPF